MDTVYITVTGFNVVAALRWIGCILSQSDRCDVDVGQVKCLISAWNSNVMRYNAHIFAFGHTYASLLARSKFWSHLISISHNAGLSRSCSKPHAAEAPLPLIDHSVETLIRDQRVTPHTIVFLDVLMWLGERSLVSWNFSCRHHRYKPSSLQTTSWRSYSLEE